MPGMGLTDDVYDATPVPGGKPLFKKFGLSTKFIDMHGKSKSFSFTIEGHEGFDRAKADALAEAMGESSNAGLIGWKAFEERWINEADAFAYDEGYSSVEVRLVLVFQNKVAFGDTLRVEIPAPDASILSNGVVDLANSLITNIVDKLDNLSGFGDYQLYTAYIWDGSARTHESFVEGLDVQEPGALDKPGPGPAGPI